MSNYMIVIFFLSFLFGSNYLDNSIYSFAKSAKTNALSNIHYLSKNINGLFYQPILQDTSLKNNSYFSYSEIYSNQFNILQLGYCIQSNEKKNISIGFIKRDINNLYNTNLAWNNNEFLIPELSNIDYENITSLLYQDFGFIISYNKYTENRILNLKFKPYYSKIQFNDSYGFDIDLIYSYSYEQFDFLFGIENLISRKKWDTGIIEKNNINYFLSNSIKFSKTSVYYEFNKNEKYKMALGYKLNNFFEVRFGFNSENIKTFGFGLSSSLFDIDYSIVNSKYNIGTSSQISILLKN